jgi:hypothetical protein
MASLRPGGREVTFTSTGTPRSAAGKLAGYWASAGSLLFSQLGVRQVPARR